MWIILLVVVIILAVLFFSKDFWLPIFNGKIGEFMVKTQLGKDIEGVSYVFNNVMVLVDGKSSQIDHVVVNEQGITCIETKNYSGRIYGEENQFQWTQVLAYGRIKNKFYNPKKQNYTHVMSLSKCLGHDYPFHSLIVFVQGNTRYINASDVIGLWDVKKRMRDIGTPGSLNSDQIKEIATRIKEIKETNVVTNQEHIESISRLKNTIDNNICPRCGGNLVLRNGKYGEFWGCSNFPNCRFIRKDKK